jgi:NDP-sugar pyrophosphorylase family protein
MEAMLLVGGKGRRLTSVVNDRPKSMAAVANRPFLEWLLLMLRIQGVRRAILCTGYMSHVIESHFRNGHRIGMEIVYSHESVPLGTGGAVRRALRKVNGKRFLVLNGDSYCRVDIERFLRNHLRAGVPASLWAVSVEDCGRYGSVEISETNAVLGFHEKAKERRSGLINAGVYLFERTVIEAIPSKRPVSLENEVFPRLVGQDLCAVVGEGPFIDIGTPESYAVAASFLVKELAWLETQQ